MTPAHNDLSRLATALEYADLGASLYLDGGSDSAARLLAAAAEQVMGDVVRLVDLAEAPENILTLLERVARGYRPKSTRGYVPQQRPLGLAGPSQTDHLRHDTEAYLRAVWFMLEALGLASLAPDSLAQAVQKSTVFGDIELEPFC
jgi:hypothetical protein